MGDPFGGRFGNFGTFRGSLFGGRDPFDDPFFTRPFEDLLEPNTFIMVRGLTIEELPSDEEEEGKDIGREEHTGSENQPSVEHPEDDSDAERKIQNVNQRSNFNVKRVHSLELKHLGITPLRWWLRKAERRIRLRVKPLISRGINDKGHSVTRKLNSSGGVESTQTLHNLDEDELSGFEEAWKGNSSLATHESIGSRSFGGWLLPSLDQTPRRADLFQSGSRRSARGDKKVVRINIE
ncbi:hypothetical protein Bca52824_097125 [Brassica carinata]|uniref:Uncharacterized protein n=1 Tax=Brassica carinata TaxID=52824 RepID=A0A8X7TGE1_BRACI|nr:hypothetical protein Bca52824_097125 [Brassica carinata]